MRKMKLPLGSDAGQVNVIHHITLNDRSEYYITDERLDDDDELLLCPRCNPGAVMAYVVRNSGGSYGMVYLSEIKPHILGQTSDLQKILPAPNASWID